MPPGRRALGGAALGGAPGPLGSAGTPSNRARIRTQPSGGTSRDSSEGDAPPPVVRGARCEREGEGSAAGAHRTRGPGVHRSAPGRRRVGRLRGLGASHVGDPGSQWQAFAKARGRSTRPDGTRLEKAEQGTATAEHGDQRRRELEKSGCPCRSREGPLPAKPLPAKTPAGEDPCRAGPCGDAPGEAQERPAKSRSVIRGRQGSEERCQAAGITPAEQHRGQRHAEALELRGVRT
jgi:hypothetical protein